MTAALKLNPIAQVGSSDLELLTAVLRDAEQAAKVLEAFGSLWEMGRRPAADLHLAGLPAAKASALFAALELGRRSMVVVDRPLLTMPEQVAAYFGPKLAGLQTEEFWVACLDSKKCLVRAERVATGGFAACSIMAREVFAPAIRAGAVAMVLVHNHPSGNPEPSPDDLRLTDVLRRGGETLGIQVLDHVIVAGDRHASLRVLGHLR